MTGTVATSRELELTAALTAVRARLARAGEAAGRNVAEIELLPVTKFFPASDVFILRRLGCEAFGEAREQEGSNKAEEVGRMSGAQPIRWHMVGQIQRNKVRSIAGWAYAVHSVDSTRVIDALDRAAGQAQAEGRRTDTLRIYVQLSLDGDEQRGGVDLARPDLVDEMCAAVQAADGLEFVGLMAIPPLGSDADDAFARLARERARVQRGYPQPLELSAGMSADLEIAVKHGSSCVRVGTALMGPRPLTSP